MNQRGHDKSTILDMIGPLVEIMHQIDNIRKTQIDESTKPAIEKIKKATKELQEIIFKLEEEQKRIEG